MSDADPGTWDAAAADFDADPDHGLRVPAVRAAWRSLLAAVLPGSPADVVDLGCGTGSLALLAAEAGHRVVGVDFAPRMLERARAKGAAAGLDVEWRLGDAARPPVTAASVDVVLERHVLWALPDPVGALTAWRALLRPGGSIVLVEGRWWTGAGLAAEDLRVSLSAAGLTAAITPLPDPSLWGGPLRDERYLATVRL